MMNKLKFLIKSVVDSQDFLKRKLNLLLIGLMLLLSGCAMNSEKPQPIIKTVTEYQKIDIKCPDAPNVEPLRFLKFRWLVADDPKTGLKVMGLTPDHYENLSKNTAKTLQYIKKQKKVVEYYRDCISKFNQKQEN